MLNLLCKTVQDYPARLHASYCATLQRVGYLARCCTQDVARYLARNIASCRQAFIQTVGGALDGLGGEANIRLVAYYLEGLFVVVM